MRASLRLPLQDAGQHARNVTVRGNQGMCRAPIEVGVLPKTSSFIMTYWPISLFNVAAATSAAFLEASRVLVSSEF